MFERYTEKARRSIFFARWEASQFGSPYIEPEHLLLGLMRHTKVLTEAIRAEIEQSLPRAEKVSTSVDLPVSQSLKRGLAYASEEAERLNHQHIGVEHLLLGLTRIGDSIVPGVLQKHGIDRDAILRESTDEHPAVVADRESLRALVDKLPEGSLERAKQALERVQTWPPAAPRRIAEIQEQMRARFRQGLKPGMGGGGGGGGNWRVDATGRISHGRYSSTRTEDGEEVVETHHFHDGHEITLIERFRLSEDGKILSYTQEISGPGGSAQHTIDFDVSGV